MLKCRSGSEGVTLSYRCVFVPWRFLLLLAAAIGLIFGQAEPACAAGFSATGSMVTARQDYTATPLDDGTVLITGGMSTSSVVINTAEIYNPSTGTFSPVGSMIEARRFHTATKLANGKVLIAGGVSSAGTPISSAELYDPATKAFTATGAMNFIRRNHTATYLPAINKVLITGGRTGTLSSTTLSSAELFDPTGSGNAGTFTLTANPMTRVRTYHAASLLLTDGKVLITGGLTTSGASTATAELYDPGTDQFSAAGNMLVARNYHTTVVLTDGRVLVTGGTSGSFGPSLATAELYDPVAATFSFTATNMNAGHSRHTAVLLSNGYVLVAGDFSELGLPGGQAEVFLPTAGDSVQDYFIPMDSMISARSNFSGVTLNNGIVLLTGGATGVPPGVVPTALAELFNMSAFTVSPVGHTFPDTAAGRTSAAQVFTISTNADLAIAPFTISGANAGMFTVSGTTCATQQVPAPDPENPPPPSLVAPGSCTVSVTFTPASVGFFSASLDILTDDPFIPTRSIPLSGTGIPLWMVTVNFAATPSGPGAGSVHSISDPTQTQQISCSGGAGTSCQQQFPHGTQVTLSATADSSNSLFGSWSGGGCSGTGDCVISSLTADTAVTATFDYIGLAKVVRPQLLYDSLQGAYSDDVLTINGDEIRVREFTFAESPVFDREIEITLDGGYDTVYSDNTDRYSVLRGVMNIRSTSGRVNVRNLIIRQM